ncbi:MAG: hypothetical protein JWP63_2678 [Candidatus Solibacter sp.]|nr:hypothetical protein [Candidatus Solibacter sp.]
MAEPARAELIKFLNGPAVEVVPIAARIGLQIDAEATEKECNFVLYSTMTQKAGSSSTKKGFLHGATSMAGMLPMLGAARRVGGAVAVTAASSAMSGIAEAASTVKARDEWTFSYKLAPAGNAAAPVLESSAAGKAKADGENVISPLLRQAAEAVLTKVMTK